MSKPLQAGKRRYAIFASEDRQQMYAVIFIGSAAGFADTVKYRLPVEAGDKQAAAFARVWDTLTDAYEQVSLWYWAVTCESIRPTAPVPASLTSNVDPWLNNILDDTLDAYCEQNNITRLSETVTVIPDDRQDKQDVAMLSISPQKLQQYHSLCGECLITPVQGYQPVHVIVKLCPVITQQGQYTCALHITARIRVYICPNDTATYDLDKTACTPVTAERALYGVLCIVGDDDGISVE